MRFLSLMGLVVAMLGSAVAVNAHNEAGNARCARELARELARSGCSQEEIEEIVYTQCYTFNRTLGPSVASFHLCDENGEPVVNWNAFFEAIFSKKGASTNSSSNEKP